ncbi:hypothetical protein IJ765_03835 [Candidatus Saccharibacteria bacterium]|nr:hypothetical protein [Candidatus Saccharibacteria bacterium]
MNPNRITPTPEQSPKLDRAKVRQLGRITTEDLWDDGITEGFYDTPDETAYGRAEFEENLDPETVARRETIAALERPLNEEFESADADLIDSPFIDNDYNRALDGDAEARERVEALRGWVLDALRAQEETLARQQEIYHITEERKARTAEIAKKIYHRAKIGILAMAGAAALFLTPAHLVGEDSEHVQATTAPHETMATVEHDMPVYLGETPVVDAGDIGLVEKVPETNDTSSEVFNIPEMAETEAKTLSPSTGEMESTPAFEEITEEASAEPDVIEEDPAETEVQHVEDDYEWDGPVINAVNGTVEGPSGKETYYNLPMQGVVDIMRSMGNTDEYWVREDGCKMLGDYIMVAADLNIHPRGSLVPTSRGMGIVCDTGEFIYSNPQQLDIATDW